MGQLDFFGDRREAKAISTDIFDYVPALFSPEESKYFKEKFITEIAWEQTSILMYGKRIPTPRLTAWYGECGGKATSPWTKDLLSIKEKVEILAGISFNYVLLNYYRDGGDSVAWHDDMDRVPGKNKMVASVSFGQERYFDIRNKADHNNKISILLEDGSYILMKGEFQDKWQHRIAKSPKPMEARINLTFRIMQ